MRVRENSNPQLLMYSSIQHFVGSVQRLRVQDVSRPLRACSGYGPPIQLPCVLRERDPSLKREVLRVRQMKMSCCRPKLSHTFKNVRPGSYTLQIRMRLTNAGGDDTADATAAAENGHQEVCEAAAAAANGRQAPKTGFFRICRHDSKQFKRQASMEDLVGTSKVKKKIF